jgi:hypothetical protein
VQICSSDESGSSSSSRPAIALDCPPGSLVRCQPPPLQGQFITLNLPNIVVRSSVFLWCGNLCCGTGIIIPGSRIQIFPSQIQGHKDSGSRMQIRDKEFKYCERKKLFLSSRKYDPGFSSRTRILIFNLSRIPDAGVKKVPTGSRIRIRNTDQLMEMD